MKREHSEGRRQSDAGGGGGSGETSGFGKRRRQVDFLPLWQFPVGITAFPYMQFSMVNSYFFM